MGDFVNKVRTIERKFLELSPSDYQRLCDEYLTLKLRKNNIVPLGTMDGASKTTKGTPDSYFVLDNGMYILIQYGSNERNALSKIDGDIKKCIDYAREEKLLLQIQKIICMNASSNIPPHRMEELLSKYQDYNIQIITASELARDLVYEYPHLAKNYFGIEPFSGTFLILEDFIKDNENQPLSTPLDNIFVDRENELIELKNKIEENFFVIVKGPAGIGKTRLVVEFLKQNVNRKIFCVSENGNSVYEDLPFLLKEDESYLLFIDDINEVSKKNVQHIIKFILNNHLKDNVTIVATVRDYALESILSLTKSLSFSSTILELKSENDEHIQNIIEVNYSEMNSIFTDQVKRIAKGNPRMATLIAEIGKQGGFEKDWTIPDVYHHYYKKIIDDNSLTNIEQKTLFISAFLGKHSIIEESNSAMNYVLERLDIKRSQYTESIYKLNNSELISFFKDEVAEIADQNFRDYILYFGFIDQKYIKISSLINELFPEYSEKIIQFLNIIIGIFKEKDTNEYISREIQEAWDNAEGNFDEYLEYFATFYPNQAFKRLNERIKNTVQENTKWDSLENNNRNVQIRDFNLKVLSLFMQSNDSNDTEVENNQQIALGLLFNYFDRKPDLIYEVFEVLKADNNITRFTYFSDYNTANLILKKIQEKESSNNKDQYNELFLLLSENYLQYSFENTRYLGSGRLNFSKIAICDNEGQRDLRKTIFLHLKNIQNEDNEDRIHSIVFESRFNSILDGLEDDYDKLIQFEIKQIYNIFISDWNEIDFKKAAILRRLEHCFSLNNINTEINLSIYQENEEYLLYLKFSGEGTEISEYDFNKIIENQENFINNYAEEIIENNISQLVSILETIQNHDIPEIMENRYIFNMGISHLINKIDVNICFDLYLKLRDRGGLNHYFVAHFSQKIIRENMTADIIGKLDSPEDNFLLFNLYKSLDTSELSEQYVERLFNVVKSENKFFIPILELVKFKSYPRIIDQFLNTYLERAKDNPQLVADYLAFNDRDDFYKIESLLNDNLEILEELYFLAKKELYDYDLLFFKYLLKNSDEDFLIKFYSEDAYFNLDRFTEALWLEADFDEYIDLIYSIYSHRTGMLDLYSNNIFCSSKNEKVRVRQINWIKKYIDINSDNEELLVKVLSCIRSNFKLVDRIELTLYFIEKNDDPNLFQKLPLYNAHMGAQFQMTKIERDSILFHKELLEKIDQTKYLDHVILIRERIERLEKQIERIEISEYLEDW